jgi:MoaA/NifB/PqqE/SkfB family radical SAM enzyme
MTFKELVRLAIRGGPGFLQLAVTNACNARCRFCSFPHLPSSNWCMADPNRLSRGFQALQRAGSKYVCYTGGEPLLYPGLLDSLAQARSLGLETLLVTNGVLLNPALIRDFYAVGLKTLIISIDAASEAAHDHHRGVPGLISHLKEVLPLIPPAGMQAVASVTLSRLLDDLDALVRFVRQLGFTRLTFSYPLTWLSSSYLGFADSHLVNFSPAELDQRFSQILALKKRSPLIILNPRLALEEARRHLRGLSGRFPCLAGFKYFLRTGAWKFTAAISSLTPWVLWRRLTGLPPSGTAVMPATLTVTGIPASFSMSRSPWRTPWPLGVRGRSSGGSSRFLPPKTSFPSSPPWKHGIGSDNH